MVSRKTVCLWLGFVVTVIILHVALRGNLVTVKGYLVIIVLTIYLSIY